MCYCLNSISTLGVSVNSSLCDIPCDGDSNDHCGGNTLYLNTLYQISNQIIEKPFIEEVNMVYTNLTQNCTEDNSIITCQNVTNTYNYIQYLKTNLTNKSI